MGGSGGDALHVNAADWARRGGLEERRRGCGIRCSHIDSALPSRASASAASVVAAAPTAAPAWYLGCWRFGSAVPLGMSKCTVWSSTPESKPALGLVRLRLWSAHCRLRQLIRTLLSLLLRRTARRLLLLDPSCRCSRATARQHSFQRMAEEAVCASTRGAESARLLHRRSGRRRTVALSRASGKHALRWVAKEAVWASAGGRETAWSRTPSASPSAGARTASATTMLHL